MSSFYHNLLDTKKASVETKAVKPTIMKNNLLVTLRYNYIATPKYFHLAKADPRVAQPFYNSLSKES